MFGQSDDRWPLVLERWSDTALRTDNESSRQAFSKHPATYYYEEGFADDLEVSTHRPVLNVIKIKFDHALVVDFASAADLPGTGQSGQYLEALSICLCIQG